MRQSLLFAVTALSAIAQVRSLSNPRGWPPATNGDGRILTREQGAALEKRQIINIDGSGNVNVEGNGTAEVKTVDAQNHAAAGGDGGILAGILNALNGNNNNNNNNNNNKNCPPAAPPVTVTQTVYMNASIPAPLTVFVTQAAA